MWVTRAHRASTPSRGKGTWLYTKQWDYCWIPVEGKKNKAMSRLVRHFIHSGRESESKWTGRGQASCWAFSATDFCQFSAFTWHSRKSNYWLSMQCKRDRLRRSFVPMAIQLFNTSRKGKREFNFSSWVSLSLSLALQLTILAILAPHLACGNKPCRLLIYLNNLFVYVLKIYNFIL